MRLGFYADYSESVARFAHEVGFDSMELSAWPKSSLDANVATPKSIDAILKDLNSKDIEISALGYYPNYLDLAEGEHDKKYLLKVMDLAKQMGVKTIATFAGRDPSKSVADNMPIFKEVFSCLADEAEKRGVQLAIENCPMMNNKEMKGTNIAFSPEIWAQMFDLVPSRAIGLEIDPSHMVWQQIDYIKAIHDFGDRIYHIHAKDMEIVREKLGATGIYGQVFGQPFGLGHGWWRARTPGWGEVNWPQFISALIEVNYSGNVDIEHEDDVFAYAAKLGMAAEEADIVSIYGQETKGLRLGYNTLRNLIAKKT